MANQSYRELLRTKLGTLVTEHNAEMGDECFEELCTLVNEECLRSFKNGLAAGKGRDNRPRRANAHVKGTALQNGRLRPREKELVVEEA